MNTVATIEMTLDTTNLPQLNALCRKVKRTRAALSKIRIRAGRRLLKVDPRIIHLLDVMDWNPVGCLVPIGRKHGKVVVKPATPQVSRGVNRRPDDYSDV